MVILHAGFVDFKITWKAKVYDDAPQSSSAEEFGTHGINFYTRKAANEDELIREFAKLNCALPG